MPAPPVRRPGGAGVTEGARRILVATRSAGKLREIQALFAGSRCTAIGLDAAGIAEGDDEEALECATTFAENALAKARHFYRRSGLPTVADDSGLEVTALGGAPGVHSKRWSGTSGLTGDALDAANNALLLERLRDATDRSARYVCVAAYHDATREFTERGETAGVIVAMPRGTNGFGYDPYFASPELAGRTFGEVAMREKSRVSHRARAFARLLRRIESGR